MSELWFSPQQLTAICKNHDIELWTTFAVVADQNGNPNFLDSSTSDSVVQDAVADAIAGGIHPERIQIINHHKIGGNNNFTPMPFERGGR